MQLYEINFQCLSYWFLETSGFQHQQKSSKKKLKKKNGFETPG
jgi:hypothetical protein